MITCANCGEHLSGDGYSVVRHCPDAPAELVCCAEPDASPIYCDQEEPEND